MLSQYGERRGREGGKKERTFLAPMSRLINSAMSVGRAMRDVPAREKERESEHHGERRETRERGKRTSVNSRSRVLQLEFLLSKLNLLQLNLPVPLPPNRDIINLTRVVTRVKSTERRFALFRVRAEPEGKDGIVEEALVDHLVEGGDDTGDRDGVVGETENTVCGEGVGSVSTSSNGKGREQESNAPNFPNANANPGSLVDSAKSCFLTVKSPIVSVSCEMIPSRAPEPYWILNSVPLALYDEDLVASYLDCCACNRRRLVTDNELGEEKNDEKKEGRGGARTWRKQAMLEHLVEGTQRLDEPVSRTTLNDWGGVPRVISEKYCE